MPAFDPESGKSPALEELSDIMQKGAKNDGTVDPQIAASCSHRNPPQKLVPRYAGRSLA